jgi:hypothetical protein
MGKMSIPPRAVVPTGPDAAAGDRTTARTSSARARRVLWVGSTSGVEFGLARSGLTAHVDVVELARATDAHDAALAGGDLAPVFAVLASDRPGRFTVADAAALSRRWPLMPIVSVASSLVEGRRRSGPQLPGVEEVAWHDLAGRSGWWLAALDAGLPTGLGMPATARREERLLESLAALTRRPDWAGTDVAVAAGRPLELEGLCDLLEIAGHRVVHRSCGRPRIDETAAAVVWDVGDLLPDQLAWLRLLAANRPGLEIVLLESFPRGDTAAAATQAGAAAILGRPVSLEALAGTLLQRPVLKNAADAGLGRPTAGR